jgi:predicted amidophosphoribosyltransferase
MQISKFPTIPRVCRACRVPLKPAEREHCHQCSTGSDFFDAAVAFLRTQPKRRTRRWAR